MSDNQKVFHLKTDDQGIAWVTIDVIGESQNTLREEFAAEAEALLKDLSAKSAIEGVIFISGKENGFIAGANISMLEKADSIEQATQLSRQGQQLFDQIEDLNMPVIAAIHGACLGGGLEFALAASHRVVSDDKSTRLGLPEVQLGLLPGGGGTQRLPRLIGIAASLDLMLTGKQVDARRAKKLGLVDEVVPLSNLRKAAVKMLQKAKTKTKRKIRDLSPRFDWHGLTQLPGIQKNLLETTSRGRQIIFDKALETVNRKTRGNYPAPAKIIDCVRVGIEQGYINGLATEARHFGELVMSKEAAQLMNIFFATTELKKETGTKEAVKPLAINRVGVLGGGLMGAGIAFVTADKAKKKVRIKDQNDQGINHALKYCWEIYRKKIKRRSISLSEASKRFAQITGTTSYQGFKRCELVIEAVFENLELKQQMVKDIEGLAGEKAIFASNTSSIPIHKIAQASQRPERVIGLHYFSPVEKMPLLEIVVTDQTAPEVIATCVEFGKAQGKTVIVVKDGVGFYTSRILGPFVNEAGHLLNEGVAIERIDSALKDAGFPVGPITLLDEVGIDVGTKIAPILAEEFGDRMLPPAAFSRLIDDDRKGRKNKRGFYRYDVKGKKPVDESVYRLLGVSPTNQMEPSVIAERCLLQMVNEAVMCLQENILSCPRDGDIGAIFGLGFPPFLGGPFRYADATGIAQLVERLRHYEKQFGERFAPAEMLVKMAEKEETFYSTK